MTRADVEEWIFEFVLLILELPAAGWITLWEWRERRKDRHHG